MLLDSIRLLVLFRVGFADAVVVDAVFGVDVDLVVVVVIVVVVDVVTVERHFGHFFADNSPHPSL